jgi:hypothetical protein
MHRGHRYYLHWKSILFRSSLRKYYKKFTFKTVKIIDHKLRRLKFIWIKWSKLQIYSGRSQLIPITYNPMFKIKKYQSCWKGGFRYQTSFPLTIFFIIPFHNIRQLKNILFSIVSFLFLWLARYFQEKR